MTYRERREAKADAAYNTAKKRLAELDRPRETETPTQRCENCGIGPFFYVPGRAHPTLCLDCADAH